MAASRFSIKCKTEFGTYTLCDINAKNTVKELKEALSKATTIEMEYMRILSGYPPRPLGYELEEATLTEVNINSGDTIIIEVLRNPVKRPKHTGTPNDPIRVLDADSEEEEEQPEVEKPPETGIMMRHIVPANNSCLFTSVYFILTHGDLDLVKANDLRRVIAKSVQNNPEKYTEAVLGMNPHDYCSWIMNPDHWGGAIELAILSEYLKLEICAIDTLSLTMHRFGENEYYDSRIFLIYDGIHYDPLTLELNSAFQGVFPSTDEVAMDMAMEVAREAQSSRQFTDVANFTLKCLDCDFRVRGDQEARDHARETGHVDFDETE